MDTNARQRDQALVELEVHGISTLPRDAAADVSGPILTRALQELDCAQVCTLTLLAGTGSDEALATLIDSIKNWPALSTLNVRWNHATSAAVPQALVDLHLHCRTEGIGFHVDFCLDPDSDGFDVLARKSTVLAQVLELSQSMLRHGIDVRWLIPTYRTLVFRIEGLYSLARDNAIRPIIVPIEVMHSFAKAETLTADERLFLWDFISYRLLETDRCQLDSGQLHYYTDLQGYFARPDCSLERSEISVLVCDRAHDDWRLARQSLPGAELRSLALDRTTSGWETKKSWPQLQSIKDIARVLIEGCRSHLLRTLVRKKPNAPIDRGKTLGKALLIGAYGGEHIGDAAILGGVLCRIHERYGIGEAVLMSQRPIHTNHLLPMLDVPVAVTVDTYDWQQIRSNMAQVDLVVFAGGPLIDLPKQLVRHLYTASLARKLGKPFIAEGIGPGPFARFASKWTARRLLELAERVTLRTSEGAEHEVVQGLEVEVGHCPAFDYLSTRGAELSRLPSADRVAIDTLLDGTKGRPVIGLNIRPIGHLYTAGFGDQNPAAYTRSIETRFEQQLANGLREFHRNADPDKKPCYVFFPMNAIQFGMSDLLSAYRLQKLLGHDVDYRVWESDASLDGVVAMLRRLDVAITMRFHATIFALSQNCKVIGVDYRIGKRDKVAELMDDASKGMDCTRIDLLTGEWLAKRLVTLTDRRDRGPA